MALHTKRADRLNARRESLMGILAVIVVLLLAAVGVVALVMTGIFNPAQVGSPLVETSADVLPIQTQPGASAANYLVGAIVKEVIPTSVGARTKASSGQKQGMTPAQLEQIQRENEQKLLELTLNPDIETMDIDKALVDIVEPRFVVPENQRITVKRGELNLNKALPEEWLNVLLLGSDNRDGTVAGGRTDVMLILSVNKTTGALKLSSIARDIYTEIPMMTEKTKLNAAHAYGGPNLTMKALNTLFDMNLEYYVTINFHGLAKIIDIFGGVYIELRPGEAEQLNYNVAVSEDYEGFAKSESRTTVPKDTVGLTRLDGLQAVSYARIRHLDSDLERTNRQRILLEAVMQMASSDADRSKLIMMTTAMLPYVTTNMSIQDIVKLGITVVGSGVPNMEQMSVPIKDSFAYAQDNGESVLDINFNVNKTALHSFIFGQYIPRAK